MKPWVLGGQGVAFVGAVVAGLMVGCASSASAQAAQRPVVVELFTAQGCSGCPEANRLLESLDQDAGVIALTYGVGYWDYLGWSDTFARPEFAARQRAYRQALHLRNVATPQVIIDGSRQVSGGREDELKAALGSFDLNRLPPPQIEFRESGDRVGVGSGRVPEGGAEVIAVLYRPGVQTVEVNRGDNQGVRVRHLNVVREVHHLGPWQGRPALYALPAKKVPEDNVVVFVQAKGDLHILSAALSKEPERD